MKVPNWIPPLTDREREIAELVWQGRTSREISCILDISLKTVEAHRANVMKKWRVRGVVEMMKAGMKLGLFRKM